MAVAPALIPGTVAGAGVQVARAAGRLHGLACVVIGPSSTAVWPLVRAAQRAGGPGSTAVHAVLVAGAASCRCGFGVAPTRDRYTARRHDAGKRPIRTGSRRKHTRRRRMEAG